VNPLQHILIFLVRAYRRLISPAQVFLFGANAGCRFTPTCSAYAMDAVKTHGAFAGSWLAVKRICRCHPWGGCGCDEVPKQFRVSSFEFQISKSSR
jgi:putative membrane protein insertion efficiency factor